MASRAATGRIIAIVVALGLSLGGAFLLWQYVSGVDQRAQEGATLTNVYVAAGGIPQGMTAQTAVQSNLIESDQVPAANVPEGAITQLEQISGLVATAPILPGEIIQSARFDDPTVASATIEVPPDRVAMSIQVPVPEGVAGYLTPGDRIAIIGHLEVQVGDTPVVSPDGEVLLEADGATDQQAPQSRYVASDVQVLGVGQRVIVTDDQGNQGDQVQQSEQVLITVGVSPEDAERLAYMHYQGQMYFTLLPDGLELPDTPGRTADTVFE